MDIVLNPIVSRLVNTLIDFVNEGLHSILDVPEEIHKLRETLCSIQDVLNDAEERQITQQAVKRWLCRLTDFMYDADDILDMYRIAAEEWALQENPPKEQSLCCRKLTFFDCFRQVKFTHKIGFRIKDLNKRLEEISAIRTTLDLRVSDRRREVTRVGRETSSDVEPDIVGEAIEKDTRHLVGLLLRKDENANANVVVLAIVGIGGIGKTTLAQKIFNDNKIKAAFQKKTVWVCVSQEFVETDLLREIITSAGGSVGEARSKAQLESKLKDVLSDSKFLLVLDDVWDAKIWEDLLRKPLQVGAVGSRVLITTRNQRIAERTKAIHIHRVNPLPLDDSWLLLCKKVTKNVEEERDAQGLKDIGMKIVEKCQGLPLAITVIGGVLCGKLSMWEWERVELSSAWSQTGLPDGVHQALYLSYEDLSPHLKQCFLHCSLFREDSELCIPTLVGLWIAEGFVVKVEGEEYPSLEEIAQGYFDELIQRSLLQMHEFNFLYCIMHDLLRSLCHFLARGQSLIISDIHKHTADVDSIKLRRLSIIAPESEDIKPFLRVTQHHKSVRTLFLENLATLDDRDVEYCFDNFHHLRVVHLSQTLIRSLPESVGNLLHLRYLNLEGCNELKALPDSIERLKYLQFLILARCSNLRTLPEGVVKLRNLRTLNLLRVPLEELPSGIVRLEYLNVLKGAVVSSISRDSSSNSCSSSCSLEEISQLRKLRELSIFNLGVTSAESDPNVNGLNNSFIAFNNLKSLALFCGPYTMSKQPEASYTNDETERIEKIFDVVLHPPSHVHRIAISDFFGRQFPRWLMSISISSFRNLTRLRLLSCRNCSLLPPLGKLPYLKSLDLQELDAVTSIGAEFYGYEKVSTSVIHESGGSKNASSPVLFPRLNFLSLVSLHNLKTWHWVPEDAGIVVMPCLIELSLYCCAKLKSLPEGLNHQAIHLTRLTFVKNNIISINGFPYVKKLSIFGETSLQIVSHFPALEVLYVKLYGRERVSFPEWLGCSLPHLKSIHKLQLICENEQLLYRCLQDGPDWPKINHIPVVEISDHQGNYITYIKHSSTFLTNII